MVEPLLSGIVLGLIAVTLAGLFYAAYSQYRRDNELSMGAYDKYKEDDQFSVENYDET